MKAFPTPKITMTKWWIKTSSANDTEGIFKPATYLHNQFPSLNARGVQGYYFVYPTSIWAEMWTADQESGIDRAKELWNPVFAGMEKFPGMNKTIYQYTDYSDYKEWFDRIFGPLGPSDHSSAPPELEGAYPRGIARLDSRLLGASHLLSPKLEEALRGSMPKFENGMLRGHLVGGGQVAVSGNDTSVIPAWRSSLVHLIATGSGAPNVTALKKLAPETGCYANEVSPCSVSTDFRAKTFVSALFGRSHSKQRCGVKTMIGYIQSKPASIIMAHSGQLQGLERMTSKL
jgi:hypothetical protein